MPERFLLILFVFLISFPAIADDWDDEWEEDEQDAVEVHGFLEAGLGSYTDGNPADTNGDFSLAEIVARLELSYLWSDIDLSLKGDVHADGAVDENKLKIREATAQYSWNSVDISAGRQVLTWGTGDLIFLNDIFPKDYQSFFSGRDLEYLKAPSDAIKLGYFGSAVNIDFIWMPEFEPDIYIDGERFSYFSSIAGNIIAAPPKILPQHPSEKLSNGEIAIRIYDSIDGIEWALYGYRGFWGQPTAIDTSGNPTFARLNDYGASIRSSLWSGIANAEISYYQSIQDQDSANPLVPNDQLRFLLGYEAEVIAKLTFGLQYYIEHTLDYDELLNASMFPRNEQDESKHWVTTRVNYRAYRDNLNISIFAFISPTDNDGYIRPAISYRIDDIWSIAAGANVFYGSGTHTFWGQFDKNDNIYLRTRFSF
ncbi:MAG: hypothetical protein D6B28_00325 [Gammaproteobacteria bacterium]|nr:MAG: hypothetical protein D6B28_00325 [Gammaproteobacteria bacterium]